MEFAPPCNYPGDPAPLEEGTGLWSHPPCSTEVLSCVPLLPPCSETLAQPLAVCCSLQRTPVSHWTLNPCCPLVSEQAEAPPAGKFGLPSAPSVLPAAAPAQSRLLGKAKGTQNMEKQHLKLLCLSSAVSVWDVSSAMGSVVVSC